MKVTVPFRFYCNSYDQMRKSTGIQINWRNCLQYKTLQIYKSYVKGTLKQHSHVEMQTMQTADCRLCRPFRLRRLCILSVIFSQFSSKTFTIVSCFLTLCALCITIICCTDVYLQGSWVENKKITGSCLPADVKAVTHAFSRAAFTQERARWRKVSCFFL